MKRIAVFVLAALLAGGAWAEGDAASLRAMLRNLTETYGTAFPEGPALLAKAEALGDKPAPEALEALRLEAARANPLLKGKPIAFVARRQYAQDHHNTHTMFPSAEGEINDGAYRPGGAIRIEGPGEVLEKMKNMEVESDFLIQKYLCIFVNSTKF